MWSDVRAAALEFFEPLLARLELDLLPEAAGAEPAPGNVALRRKARGILAVL